MTIGFILDDTLDKNDGVQVAIIELGRELTERGHQVHYLVADTKRKDLPNVHSLGKIKQLRFNANSVRTPTKAYTKKIKHLFSQVTFDVLHVQMPYSPLLSGKIIRLAPPTTHIVGTFHILPYGNLSKISARILGRFLSFGSLKKIRNFTAVSEPALNFMQEVYGVSGRVIANPVNTSFYAGFKKEQKKQKQIVFLGRFDERKGVRQLAAAYAGLDSQVRSDCLLTMCGSGPLHDEIVAYAHEHNLNIAFPGFVSNEEKAQYLANADVAVFPATGGESFGIVLVEAMAARAGVTIGGNNPGYASVLSPWPKSLFNPNDTTAFTNILTRALNDASFKRIGEKQHRYVERFSTVHVVDALENIYTK